MSKTRPGRAPSLLRGRWCAPDRRLSSGRHLPLSSGQSLRPRSNYPPAGVTFTKRHRGFTHVHPSPRTQITAQGREPASPHRSSPRLCPPGGTADLGLLPRASHPAVTHDARRGGDGPSRTGPSTTPSASSRTSNSASYFNSCPLTSHVVAGRLHHHAVTRWPTRWSPGQGSGRRRTPRRDRLDRPSASRPGTRTQTFASFLEMSIPAHRGWITSMTHHAPSRTTELLGQCGVRRGKGRTTRSLTLGLVTPGHGTNPRFPWQPSATMLTCELTAPRSLRGRPRRTRPA